MKLVALPSHSLPPAFDLDSIGGLCRGGGGGGGGGKRDTSLGVVLHSTIDEVLLSAILFVVLATTRISNCVHQCTCVCIVYLISGMSMHVCILIL